MRTHGRRVLKKKVAARGVGGTAAGAAAAGGTAAAAGSVVATGVAASAIAGVFTFGIGAIVGLGITAAAAATVGVAGAAAGITTAVATHYIASKYAKSEAEFKRIRGNFDTLLSFAFGLKEEWLKFTPFGIMLQHKSTASSTLSTGEICL